MANLSINDMKLHGKSRNVDVYENISSYQLENMF